MIAFQNNLARVVGQVGDEKVKREVVIFKKEGEIEKRYFINGVNKRLSDFLGSFLVVSFGPAEIDFLFSSPWARRYHLDLFLASCDNDYYRALVALEKILKSRNRVLEKIRENKAGERELFFWDRELLDKGGQIQAAREVFFQFLKEKAGNFDFVYKKNKFEAQEEVKKEEIRRGVSLFGPQRDDFGFFLKKLDLELFGSRGEQRLAVLALKLLELTFLNERLKVKPVLVLDDIFSELDKTAKEKVLKVIGRQQTVVTSIDPQSERLLPPEKEVIRLG